MINNVKSNKDISLIDLKDWNRYYYDRESAINKMKEYNNLRPNRNNLAVWKYKNTKIEYKEFKDSKVTHKEYFNLNYELDKLNKKDYYMIQVDPNKVINETIYDIEFNEIKSLTIFLEQENNIYEFYKKQIELRKKNVLEDINTKKIIDKINGL